MDLAVIVVIWFLSPLGRYHTVLTVVIWFLSPLGRYHTVVIWFLSPLGRYHTVVIRFPTVPLPSGALPHCYHSITTHLLRVRPRQYIVSILFCRHTLLRLLYLLMSFFAFSHAQSPLPVFPSLPSLCRSSETGSSCPPETHGTTPLVHSFAHIGTEGPRYPGGISLTAAPCTPGPTAHDCGLASAALLSPLTVWLHFFTHHLSDCACPHLSPARLPQSRPLLRRFLDHAPGYLPRLARRLEPLRGAFQRFGTRSVAAARITR